MRDYIVETHGLTKRFGLRVAVDRVESMSRADRRSATSARTVPARRP